MDFTVEWFIKCCIQIPLFALCFVDNPSKVVGDVYGFFTEPVKEGAEAIVEVVREAPPWAQAVGGIVVIEIVLFVLNAYL